MKKLISLLLALALCFSLVVSASAASAQDVTISMDNAAIPSRMFGHNNIYTAYNVSERAVQFSTNGADDPYVYLNLSDLASVSASAYPYVVLTYRAPSTNSSGSGKTQLFWMLDGSAPTEAKSSTFTVTKGYLYRSQIIDMSRNSYWKGNLTQIRIDPFANGLSAWDTLYISSIVFCSSKTAAQAAATARASAANGLLDGLSETDLSRKTYHLGTYMESLWDGNLVYHESVLPVCEPNGTMQPISLMYDIDHIISVRSSALNTEFVYGRDYEVQDGKLLIKPTGAITTIPYASLHSNTQVDANWWPCADGTYTFVMDGHIFHDYQLAITYTHSDGWDGVRPVSKTATLERTVSKLTNKQSLKIVFYGDSITVGANSSSYLNVAPKCPRWADLTVAQLKSVYGVSSISSVNTAQGGQLSDWGLSNVKSKVIKNNPDLLVLGFGMNDLTCGVSAADYQANIRGMIEAVRTSRPNCDIILVAPMIPNPAIFSNHAGTQTGYLNALRELASQYSGVAVADLTTAHRELLTRKNFADLSGNNVNHTNDFMTRVYAQTVTALLCGTETETPTPQKPAALNYVVSADLVLAPDGVTNLSAVGGNDPSRTALGTIKVDSVTLFGWLASSEKIERFGYRYGDSVVIESDKYATESAVVAAGAPVAGASGETSRFCITVPVKNGENVELNAVAQLSSGKVLDFWRVVYTNIYEPTVLLSSSFDSVALNGTVLHGSGDAKTYLASNPISYSLGSGNEIGASGWAYLNRNISGFGYRVDGGKTVTGSFFQDRADVKAAVAQSAEGYHVRVPVTSLDTGQHRIEVVVIASDGTELVIEEIPFTVKGKPGITTKSGTATVVTADGLTYTAKGYKSVVNKSSFKINSGFTMTLSQPASSFNRMSFVYSSTEPLRMTVSYVQNGSAVSDVFYLEAGTDQTFSALIQAYLDGGSASVIKTVSFDTCNGKTATAILSNISVETRPVFSDDVYYFENARFKVGLKMKWGGGICYIEDKTHKESGLTNLINSHDTGRLVQQSYYGAESGSGYKPGFYNGTTWSYNPVQGGDMYDNCSRLIDFTAYGNTVYLKIQPQDWSLNNQITPSYMENVYTLHGDSIQVDNRFTDFSGMTHPVKAQEVPAFYTVSYLDQFSFYNGTKPWSGDALTTRSDLKFWGDPDYVADCSFQIAGGNTETWCSWTSSSSKFGIGLFTPNIHLLYAGRYQFDKSKSASAESTNYVAPLIYTSLSSYQPVEYSYLITTGTVDQIRKVFQGRRSFDGSYLLDLSNSGAAALFTSRHGTSSTYNSAQQATQLKVTSNNDVYAHLNFDSMGLSLSADEFSKIQFEYMIPANSSKKQYDCELFLCTGSQTSAKAGKSVHVDLIADGQYHTATVNVGGLSFWSGQLRKIRLDYFDTCAKNDMFLIRSMTFTK